MIIGLIEWFNQCFENLWKLNLCTNSVFETLIRKKVIIQVTADFLVLTRLPLKGFMPVVEIRSKMI